MQCPRTYYSTFAPILPAVGITINRAQGKTLDRDALIFDHKCSRLSRVRGLHSRDFTDYGPSNPASHAQHCSPSSQGEEKQPSQSQPQDSGAEMDIDVDDSSKHQAMGVG